jgi:hypothetical protein
LARRTFDPIERLGVNAVEAAVLAMGHIWREQPVNDYGIDGHIEIVGDDQRPTGQLVGVQVKSGPSFFSRAGELSVPFYVSQEHWEYWSTHSLPIIVVLHDEATGRTVWEWVTPETAADAGLLNCDDCHVDVDTDSDGCTPWTAFEAVGDAAEAATEVNRTVRLVPA